MKPDLFPTSDCIESPQINIFVFSPIRVIAVINSLVEKGDLTKLQEFYRLNSDIDISANNEYVFRYACQNNHLGVAKWLLEIKPDINISTDNEEAFRYACQNGHLEVTKWLLEIKPDIQNDIYHLYCNENEYIGIACIPDFKTSKMMNNLFRKIKENDDLDKLEESDDEEEFENPNVDKYVYLGNLYKFECQFNKRFKKWVPYKIVDNNTKLSNIIDIKNEMKKHLTKPFKNYK